MSSSDIDSLAVKAPDTLYLEVHHTCLWMRPFRYLRRRQALGACKELPHARQCPSMMKSQAHAGDHSMSAAALCLDKSWVLLPLAI